jgi:hypothetical protein
MNNNSDDEIDLSDTTKRKVDFNARQKGQVKVDVDGRVARLIKHISTPDEEGNCCSGYRVQIFFDNNKQITNQEKSKFKTRYGNNIGCYTEYKAPNYRIKVGDFRTEIEAENFKQRLISVFPTAFVVKDKIHMPKLGQEVKHED